MNVKDAPTGGGAYIDGLVAGPIWNGSTITFSFPTAGQFTGYSGGEPSTNFGAFNEAQKTAVREALSSISSFTGLVFQEVTGAQAGSATLRFGTTDDTETAHAYLPSTWDVGGDAWFRNSGGEFDAPVRGNYAWITIMHEIGHTLGLGHPHEEGMPYDHDWMAYTLMSYRSSQGASLDGFLNGEWGFAQSFMMDDIAALQFLYGANYAFRNTDTTYSWNPATGEMRVNGAGQGAPGGNVIFMTVWDGGGIDTFDFSNYAGGASIDLAPGTYTYLGTQLADLGGGYVPGNIATSLLYSGDLRSLIENAIGTSGDDTIRGNQVANALTGGPGNDLIYGFDGNDTLNGGGGFDQLVGGLGSDVISGGLDTDVLAGEEGNDWLAGGDGDDALHGQLGSDELFGGAGNDTLEGGEHTDMLAGGDGDDVLNGGAGADQMIGGLGNDWYMIDDPSDQVTELAGQGTDLVETIFSYALGTGIENATVRGTGAADLTGNASNNVLQGNGAANVLNGGSGADLMRGFEGGDTYYVDNAGDQVYDRGSPGTETIYSSVSFVLADRDPNFDPYVGASPLPLSYGDNLIEYLILVGSAGISATGNKFDNTLIGNSGNNTLYGGEGNDVLDGGGGADTLIGGLGNDIYYTHGSRQLRSLKQRRAPHRDLGYGTVADRERAEQHDHRQCGQRHPPGQRRQRHARWRGRRRYDGRRRGQRHVPCRQCRRSG